MEASIGLAYLDNVFRVGVIDPNMFAPAPEELIKDLTNMVSLLGPEPFKAKKRCLLNPTFGPGFLLVGGADADLIIDDTLIDVKTSKHLVFDREMFNQIVGYYVLSCIGEVDGCPQANVKQLAVYYARYGILHQIPIDACIDRTNLQQFIRWFRKRVRGKST